MSVDEVEELAASDPEMGTGRRAVIALIVFGVTGALLALVILSRRDEPALAELRLRQDTVAVRADRDFVDAIEGQSLKGGDTVRTDDTGEVQVDFFDESLTRLDHNTTLLLRGMTKTDARKQIRLQLERGRIWNRVAPHDSEEDQYEVRAGDAIAVVRGTTFYVDCRTATCFFVGVVDHTEVSSSSGQTQTIGPNDCVATTPEAGLRRCSSRGLLDDWVRQNLAEDAQDEAFPTRTDVPTDLPTPAPAAPPARRRTRPPVRRPVATPTRAPAPPPPTAPPPTAPPPTAPPPTAPPPTDPPPPEPTEGPPPPA